MDLHPPAFFFICYRQVSANACRPHTRHKRRARWAPAIYAEFNPDWKQRIAQQNQTAPPQELIVHIQRPKFSGGASDIKVRRAAT
jgi:hypothetical protein